MRASLLRLIAFIHGIAGPLQFILASGRSVSQQILVYNILQHHSTAAPARFLAHHLLVVAASSASASSASAESLGP